MTIEEIKVLSAEDCEKRMSAIKEEMNAEDADLEALSAEVDAIEERKNALISAEESRKALAEKVANDHTATIVEERKEDKKMGNIEIRNTQEYIHAYANYVKTGDDSECRALLTENVSGTVPVPEIALSRIETAWNESDILTRVRKSNIKGNIKQGFERATYVDGVFTPAGSPAVKHTEGSGAVDEETLSLGIATMIPVTFKKWLGVSDEVLAMDDGGFLEYVYDELGHMIISAIEAEVVTQLLALTDAGSATVPAGYNIANGSATVAQIITAEGFLCDEAKNPAVISSKATATAVKNNALSLNYAVAPFDGMDNITNGTASGHILVVDLSCVRVNFPNGEDIKFVFDDKTLATSDLVRVVGKLYAGVAVVKAGMCVDVTLA